MTYQITTFYKFTTVDNPATLKAELLQACQRLAIRGSILVATEGLNATIAGADANIRDFLDGLRGDPRFSHLETKESWTEEPPFKRLKIKIKPEIVTFRDPGADPTREVGEYVSPEAWNSLVEDPGVTVIDTRNTHEVAIGTFKGALDPKTTAFHQFPDFVKSNLDPKVHTKIAMFCTGGIRCEKASSYLLSQGFEKVYHLEGGILKYLETVSPEQSLWQGECFVFDERVAVDHALEVGSYRLCDTCGRPVHKQALQQDDAPTPCTCASPAPLSLTRKRPEP